VKEANRLGVSSANLGTRHLKLEPAEREKLDAVIAEIDTLYGLASAFFDDSKGRLDMAYDATRICLDCIEEVLTKYAIKVSHDWWTHFKEGHYRFVDQNLKDNASRELWSCHKSPPGSGHNR
jgi:hypothetical protein